MPTISDVAKLAKVSTATVSAVINEKSWVSEGIRARVLSAIQKVGYSPNALARGLKIGKSGTLGMLVSDISNPFFTTVFQAVNRVAFSAGYSVVLCSSDEDAAREQTYIRLLRERKIDGLIVAPSANDEACIEFLEMVRMPTVLVDRILPDKQFDAVVVDNQVATKIAIDYLISLGHRKIGFISGPSGVWTAEERLLGYKSSVISHHLPLDEALIVQGNFTQPGGHEAALRLLDASDKPSAIFAANNKMMIGAILAIKDRGLDCPSDISLASFDDFELASAFQPPLTVVRQPADAIGEQAARLLLSRISGESAATAPVRTTFTSDLMIRGSCGKPASSSQ